MEVREAAAGLGVAEGGIVCSASPSGAALHRNFMPGSSPSRRFPPPPPPPSVPASHIPHHT